MTYERSRGDRYALTALRNKRAAMASEIKMHEQSLRHLRESLVHVDATLRLLDPDVDVEKIPNKRPPKRVKLFRQGELGRMILDALRQAKGESGTVAEITSFLLAAGGHRESARRAVSGRVRGNLAYLERKGKVEKDVTDDGVVWRLA
jgi:hypothetical protein